MSSLKVVEMQKTMTVNRVKRFSEMIGKSDLTGTQLKVLLLCLGNANYEGIAYLSQVEIADQLGLLRQNVNRAVKELVDKNLIKKVELAGKVVGYSLNLECEIAS